MQKAVTMWQAQVESYLQIHRRFVEAIIRGWLPFSSSEDREDILMDVYLRLLKSDPLIMTHALLRMYVDRVCIDYLRKIQRRPKTTSVSEETLECIPSAVEEQGDLEPVDVAQSFRKYVFRKSTKNIYRAWLCFLLTRVPAFSPIEACHILGLRGEDCLFPSLRSYLVPSEVRTHFHIPLEIASEFLSLAISQWDTCHTENLSSVAEFVALTTRKLTDAEAAAILKEPEGTTHDRVTEFMKKYHVPFKELVSKGEMA